jgi:hypothetical protein
VTGSGDWVEVSKDAFYAAMVGNVHPRIVGSWPYTSLFETPDRDLRGKIVGTLTQPGTATSRYYLPAPRPPEGASPSEQSQD